MFGWWGNKINKIRLISGFFGKKKGAVGKLDRAERTRLATHPPSESLQATQTRRSLTLPISTVSFFDPQI